MRYAILISLRYLFSKKRKRFISFMSLVSIIGVAVGVASLIVVLAVMSGFGYELQKRIIGSNPHIVIERGMGLTSSEYKEMVEKIDRLPRVEGSYPFISGQAIIRAKHATQGIAIRSVDTDNKRDIVKLGRQIKEGIVNLSENGIAVGTELAHSLDIGLGSEIEVLTTAAQKGREFKVEGIFSSGMYEYDLNFAYVRLDTASKLFETRGMVNGVGVDIDNIDNVVKSKSVVQAAIAPDYCIRTWIEVNKSLFSALKLEKWTMFVILTLIVIVAALNIISTLSVMVTEKTKDIGILKAIGATRSAIMFIFALQGLMIGAIGVLSGLAAGTGIVWALDTYRFPILPESIYYGINYLPVRMAYSDSLVIAGAAFIISLLASIYPAYEASRLHPVEALRYE